MEKFGKEALTFDDVLLVLENQKNGVEEKNGKVW
jgi:hypothetical protein